MNKDPKDIVREGFDKIAKQYDEFRGLFSDGDQLGQYIVEKKWKSTCDVFLGYTIRKLTSMVEEGKL